MVFGVVLMVFNCCVGDFVWMFFYMIDSVCGWLCDCIYLVLFGVFYVGVIVVLVMGD